MAEARDAVSALVRADLLDSIRQRRREFETAGDKAQELRTLPAETVRTLRGMGAFWLKTPAELGGWLPDAGVSEENYERAGRQRIRSYHIDGGGFG